MDRVAIREAAPTGRARSPATRANLIVHPGVSVHTRLLEDPRQQGGADFLAVGVRNRKASFAFDHEQVLAARKGG